MDEFDVYEPAEDSYLLEKFVRVHARGRVLEIGTGSGILAVEAAKSIKVKSVLAVDINSKAVEAVLEWKEKEHLKKLKVLESDLFGSVDDKFETIIFNPPYLPQDYVAGKKIVDPALYGGDKGWEVSLKFLDEMGEYLTNDGKVLFLFSSHTNKEKIDQALEKNLYDFEELAAEKCGMYEKLYVYLISQSDLRRAVVSHGVSGLKYLAKGSRGFVLSGEWKTGSLVKSHIVSGKNVAVAVKVRNPSSSAPGTLELEGKWLKELNKKGIGPRLYYSHENFLVMELVGNGIGLDKYLDLVDVNSKKGRLVLAEVLKQCRVMDETGVSKDEMHRPYANVLVVDFKEGKNEGFDHVVLIDFERCRRDPEPQNVTQFLSFLMKVGVIDLELGKELAVEYKKDYLFDTYKVIKSKVLEM